MFKRQKLREKALELSLYGAIYPMQPGFLKQEETVSSENAIAMLGSISLAGVYKTDENLYRWLEKNTH